MENGFWSVVLLIASFEALFTSVMSPFRLRAFLKTLRTRINKTQTAVTNTMKQRVLQKTKILKT